MGLGMLNELKTLSDSIRDIGISVANWDDKFKEIKTTSPCFVVSLSPKGMIADIRKLDADKAKGLRKWLGGSNGSTFPAFNFQPFYAFKEAKGKGKGPTPKERASAIANLVSLFRETRTLPKVNEPLVEQERTNADNKTAKCLGKKCADEFFSRVCADAEDGDLLVRFREAFRCFMPSGSSAESFNNKLLDFLCLCPNLEEIQDLLVRTGDVVLFFDIVDTNMGVIASESTMKTINERLLATRGIALASKGKDKKRNKSGPIEIDAFGKTLSVDVKVEKLPEVKLPGVLANTKLRSMTKDAPCQMRYGLIDAESFPVGAEIRTKAKAALEWISSADREGRTWAKAGLNELVFAYPKALPPTPPLLARMLGNGQSSGDKESQRKARFEEYAKAALAGLRNLSQNATPNTEIEVFAIKKADKARRKVVFYRNYSLGMLEKAVGEWLAGARNIPDIRFRKWPWPAKGEKAKKGTTPVPAEFRAPLPLVASKQIFTRWSQSTDEEYEPKFRPIPIHKQDKKDKEGKAPLSDGLELFLGDSVRTGLAQRMLALLLQNSVGLCVAVGNLSHRSKNDVVTNVHAVDHLETALPLIGILLHKHNHTKETYMENAPYLIGRFLNLADGLHAVWCRNVKEKDPLPPQLLGSSLFASFHLNPAQAFASASLRMKPYLDWAKTNQTKDVALSRWYLGEFGRVSAAIVKSGIPTRLSDTDKAEMLLGYLASSGKSGSDESESTESNDSSTNS